MLPRHVPVADVSWGADNMQGSCLAHKHKPTTLHVWNPTRVDMNAKYVCVWSDTFFTCFKQYMFDIVPCLLQVRNKLVPAKRRAEAGQGTTWRALAQDDLKARLAASSVRRKVMTQTMPKDQWDLEKKYAVIQCFPDVSNIYLHCRLRAKICQSCIVLQSAHQGWRDTSVF